MLDALLGALRTSAETVAVTTRDHDRGAEAMAAMLAAVLFRGRAQAKRLGHGSFVRELELAHADNPRLNPTTPLVGVRASDRERAQHGGESIAGRWRELVAEHVDAGESRQAASRRAAEQASARAAVIATTENSEAFSEERADDADNYAHDPDYESERSAGALVPFLQWDAVLDRRTCSECERLNGKITILGYGWDVNPGDVHPSCRCYDGMIMLPAWYTYEQ